LPESCSPLNLQKITLGYSDSLPIESGQNKTGEALIIRASVVAKKAYCVLLAKIQTLNTIRAIVDARGIPARTGNVTEE
jgi:hypothetical protein